MIDLYYAPTPNGLKVKLGLEEMGLAYRLVRVRLSRGDQFKPEFLKVSPNNKIPAIVDHEPEGGGEPLAIFESGAILLYLAEKTGCFLPAQTRSRLEVIQWLFWQMAGLGPMAGQMGHFNIHALEKVPYALERYRKETARLYAVLDRQLSDREYIAGDYSIADIACYPWVVPHVGLGQELEVHRHLYRWFKQITARPAVVRAYAGVEDVYSGSQSPLDDKARKVLFGSAMVAG